jgi:hypothetical protein
MFLLIAQVTAPSPTTELPGAAPIGGLFGGGAGVEIAIVLGVAMFLVLIFGFWATFIRKPQKAYISGATSATQISSRSQSRRMSKGKERGTSIDVDEDSDDEESSDGVRRKRRKRRRPHRRRMPSLAEAGGLPPIKESMEQIEPSSKQSFNSGGADAI